jgi:hypothetical protein
MSRAIPHPDIVDTAIKGVKIAFEMYGDWSGGHWLSPAPESLIQVKIAEALVADGHYVTLEDQVRDLLDAAKADKRGTLPRGNAAGRIDVIVWWQNWKPRTLIEVKRASTYDIITEDAKRLRYLVNKKDGSIQNGLIVAYIEAENRETIAQRFAAMASKSSTRLVASLGSNHTPKEVDGYWDAACFSVR